MSDGQLTLMAVHAHPDDESIGTGGILARYGDEGVRTVLVTCTDGQFGDAPGGTKPGEPDHDEDEVVRLRRAELEASCAVLGIEHLELLGYRDSGMAGWPQNDDPSAFHTVPIDAAAARLAALMEQYRPQVVVTYDEYGFYGHPDHIKANQITMAAAETSGVPDKVYYTAIARSRLAAFAERMREEGAAPPADLDEDPNFGTPDELIGAVVDCSAYIDRKMASLRCHASQAENIFFLNLDPALIAQVFGTESFVRARDRTGAPLPEDDLFAGLR